MFCMVLSISSELEKFKIKLKWQTKYKACNRFTVSHSRFKENDALINGLK